MDCGLLLDILIVGGGGAGLWLLDELTRLGYSCLLLESSALGSGQTVASQGILHGGLKYSLQGLLSASAAAVRQMPAIWRQCLLGDREPDLSNVRIRSDHCFLWQTGSISSRMAMLGARLSLQVSPRTVDPERRPPFFDSSQAVARLEEQVICPRSLIECLAAKHPRSLVRLGPEDWGADLGGPGIVRRICLRHPIRAESMAFRPRHVLLAAGSGNRHLRTKLGLDPALMQRRPLHMVMARGSLPDLYGHCVDGSRTRVTVTSDHDSSGTTVWQIGGQVAEIGAGLERGQLVARARQEMRLVLPLLDFERVEWGTYRVNRAEVVTRAGRRPAGAHASRQGNVITAWPTKLVLLPKLAEQVVDLLDRPAARSWDIRLVDHWPRPQVAVPPWEFAENWLQPSDRTAA